MGRSTRGAMGAFKENADRQKKESKGISKMDQQKVNLVLGGIVVFFFGLLAITLYI